jgi:hypothetical protein
MRFARRPQAGRTENRLRSRLACASCASLHDENIRWPEPCICDLIKPAWASLLSALICFQVKGLDKVAILRMAAMECNRLSNQPRPVVLDRRLSG